MDSVSLQLCELYCSLGQEMDMLTRAVYVCKVLIYWSELPSKTLYFTVLPVAGP